MNKKVIKYKKIKKNVLKKSFYFILVIFAVLFAARYFISQDKYFNWKKFTSKNEKFSLLYPPDWKLVDTSSNNCVSSLVNGTNCRERFNFVAPDDISVRYVEGLDSDDQRVCCDLYSKYIDRGCWFDNIKSVSKLNAPGFGNIYLVKTEKVQNNKLSQYNYLDFSEIRLQTQVPVTPDSVTRKKTSTICYQTEFNFPSKFAPNETFKLFTSSAPNSFKDLGKTLNTEEFYNKESVKQAELILRSISFK